MNPLRKFSNLLLLALLNTQGGLVLAATLQGQELGT